MTLVSLLVPKWALAQSRWARGGGEEKGEVKYGPWGCGGSAYFTPWR